MNIEKSVKRLEKQMSKDKIFFENHPEKGFKEIETSEYITKRLIEIGYNVKTNIAKTGIVATIKGKEEKPCVLFRSELDAVEMDSSGRMKHTCGHDAHMTILLALAQLIIDNKDKIKGTIKIIFTPEEQTYGGAKLMINEGVLENPKVDYVFALHVWSELKKGTIGIKSGAIMASTDPFNITVIGKGGHGALPEKCIDPIYIASSIVTNLQAIVGRNVNPNETAIVGITSIHGGNSNNVIPDKVEMNGICRTFNNELREYIKKRIEEISINIAKSMNGTAQIYFKKDNYPAVINNKEQSEIIKEIATKLVGKENVITDYKTMCADDFAYFLQKRPGAFIFVGCTDKEYYPQHSENFAVDINTILEGTQLFYEIVKMFEF